MKYAVYKQRTRGRVTVSEPATKPRIPRLVFFVTLIAASFFAGRVLVFAQVWSRPTGAPPANNSGQPPTVSNTASFLRKSPPGTQSLPGTATGAVVSSVPVELANTAGQKSAISARKSFEVPPSYPPGTSGIYAYATGTDYGLYAAAEGAGTNYALQGKADTAGYAGRFQGPLAITVNDSAPSSLTVQGLLTASSGVNCFEQLGCLGIVANPSFTVSNTVGGYALKSYSDSLPGIAINLNATAGIAAQGVATVGGLYGIGGNGTTGVYGIARGSDDADTYVGVYGENVTGNLDEVLRERKGVYGETNGGLGGSFDVRQSEKAVSNAIADVSYWNADEFGQSIAIGWDNFPVVSYYDPNDKHLYLFHCKTEDCSLKESNDPLPLDTSGDVGRMNSIAIDKSGHPVISYVYTSAGSTYLKFVHCNSINCRTALGAPNFSIKTLDNTTSISVGQYSHIAVDQNGHPVISYIDAATTDLRLIHCNDESCTPSSNDPSVLLYDDASSYNSLAIDKNNHPVVSVLKSSAPSALYVMHCTDEHCLLPIEGPATISGSTGISYNSIAIGNDNRPVVSYYNGSVGTLGLYEVHCQNENCSGLLDASPRLDGDGTVANRAGMYNAIAIDYNGHPVISYFQYVGPGNILKLKYIHCETTNCSSVTSGTPRVLDSSTYAPVSLAIDSSGRPVMSYVNYLGPGNDKSTLNVYRCVDEKCVMTIETQYDFAAGVRACVKDSAGAVLNSNGIYGTGGKYAGYFEGDLMIAGLGSGNPWGHAVLRIGDTYLTRRNLKGLLCKAGLGSC